MFKDTIKQKTVFNFNGYVYIYILSNNCIFGEHKRHL